MQSTDAAHLISWLTENAVPAQIDGLQPERIPGCGVGLVAEKPLRKGQTIVSIPSAALLTVESPHLRRLRLPQSLSTHGQLATALALWHGDPDAPLQEWRATLPKRDVMVATMPLMWPNGRSSEFLPPAAASHLKLQKEKFEQDWNATLAAPILADTVDMHDTFTYCWLLINTRCFWWDYPSLPKQSQKRRRLLRDTQQCMAMCPLMDYFNHSSQGCEVNFTKAGYTATCDRDYAVGEQLSVTYGSHNNDVLLVDYGFILPQSLNASDSISLDHHILPELSYQQANLLKEVGYHSNYVLHRAPDSPSWEPCHRTQIALFLLSDPKAAPWRTFVNGRELNQEERKMIDRTLVRTCEGVREEADGYLRRLDTLEAWDEQEDNGEGTERKKNSGKAEEISTAAKETLKMRWSQIRSVANQIIGDVDVENAK